MQLHRLNISRPMLLLATPQKQYRSSEILGHAKLELHSFESGML